RIAGRDALGAGAGSAVPRVEAARGLHQRVLHAELLRGLLVAPVDEGRAPRQPLAEPDAVQVLLDARAAVAVGRHLLHADLAARDLHDPGEQRVALVDGRRRRHRLLAEERLPRARPDHAVDAERLAEAIHRA